LASKAHKLVEAAFVGVDAIVWVISLVTCVLLSFLVCANGLEILLRGVFSHSLSWIYDVNLLLSNWIYFLGMCLVYDRKKDISLDFLRGMFSARAQKWIAIIINIIAAATFILIGRYTVCLIDLQWPFRTSGYGVPQALYSIPLLIAAAVICLILARQSAEIILDRSSSRTLHQPARG
jgi:TRAP-type C4-dicarboxylate transport system permease small subunit